MDKQLIKATVLAIAYIALAVSAILLVWTLYLWYLQEPGPEINNVIAVTLFSFVSSVVSFFIARFTVPTSSIPKALSPELLANVRTTLVRTMQRATTTYISQTPQGITTLDLALEERLDAVQRPYDLILRDHSPTPRYLPTTAKILNIFEEYNRTLLILGAPGAGKTFTLFELAKDTLDKAKSDNTFPVAVLLRLSEWRSKTTGGWGKFRQERDLDFHEWVTEQVHYSYQIKREIIKYWLENGQLLLLLDGLDEVDESQREHCVNILNNFRIQHPCPIVLTSRLAEYWLLKSKLKLESAIEIQPLSDKLIKQYFRAKSLKNVRRALEQDKYLKALARTPLFLSILVVAYRDSQDENYPLANTLTERRYQLFNTYIERMLARSQITPKDAEKLIRYLTWLAMSLSLSGESTYKADLWDLKWSHNENRHLHGILRFLFMISIIPIPFMMASGNSIPFIDSFFIIFMISYTLIANFSDSLSRTLIRTQFLFLLSVGVVLILPILLLVLSFFMVGSVGIAFTVLLFTAVMGVWSFLLTSILERLVVVLQGNYALFTNIWLNKAKNLLLIQKTPNGDWTFIHLLLQEHFAGKSVSAFQRVRHLMPLRNYEAARVVSLAGESAINPLVTAISNHEEQKFCLYALARIGTKDAFHYLNKQARSIALQPDIISANFSNMPIADLSFLSQLTSLKELKLTNTPIFDLSPLQFLTNLETLDLANTPPSDFSYLQTISNLRSLNLAGTSLTDLTEIHTLTNLKSLNLRDTQVNDLTPLHTLTNLQSLNLGGTQVSDLTPLHTLTNLQSINLNRAQVSDLTPLKTLTDLQSLSLWRSQVSDLTPLKTLTNLQSLDLGGTKISDLTPLQTLTRLQSFYLKGTQVSDLSPLQTLASLQFLYLGDTQVSDLSPLQTLTNLQSLDLWGTSVNNLSPLQTLTNLQSLVLTGTNVSDLSPLQTLTSLQSLDLRGTQVSDLTPLKALTNLQSLKLGRTQVSDLSPLQALPNLRIEGIIRKRPSL